MGPINPIKQRARGYSAGLDWLRRDAAALTQLRTAGLRNAARYPLSQTVRRLADLSDQIT